MKPGALLSLVVLGWALRPLAGEIHHSATIQILEAQPPVITDFYPKSGIVGERVGITGQNLKGTIEVKFNGVPAYFKMSTDSFFPSVDAFVPQKATTGLITVTTSEGTASTSEAFVVKEGAPLLESFSPAQGAPGTWITIRGQNLKYVTSVLINGTEVDVWGVGIDPINVYLNALVSFDATTGPITVISQQGLSTSDASFIVSAPPDLRVENWLVEIEAGMSAMLKVSNTFYVTGVQLNGVSLEFSYLDPVSLLISVPTNATSGTLTVYTPTQVISSPQPLVVYPRPIVDSVYPLSGPAGTLVQISGAHFERVIQVWVGETSVPFTPIGSGALSIAIGNHGGLITIQTQSSWIETAARFTVTNGTITTRPGTIRGAFPPSDPTLITAHPSEAGPRIPRGLATDSIAASISRKADPLRLSVTSIAGNTLKITWPTDPGGYSLETRGGFGAEDWRPVTQATALRQGINELVLAADGAQSFFRLAAQAK